MLWDPRVVLLLALIAWFCGQRAVSWIGHEGKKAGVAIAHVIKKIPHG